MNKPNESPREEKADGQHSPARTTEESGQSGRAARDPPADDDESGAVTGSSRTAVYVCEICGAAMFESHCKIICARCGYRRDCSDP